MEPAATRVKRVGWFKWEAWALVPGTDDDKPHAGAGPWFYVGTRPTKRWAQRVLNEFVERVTALDG